MNELKQPLTAQDVRYTTKDGAVYAICLGVPAGQTSAYVSGTPGRRRQNGHAAGQPGED